MSELRQVSKKERVVFPVIGMILCCYLAPASIPLLGTFFFGNFMKECGVTERLVKTARTAIIDIATIFLGFTVGNKHPCPVFLISLYAHLSKSSKSACL